MNCPKCKIGTLVPEENRERYECSNPNCKVVITKEQLLTDKE